MNTAGRRVLDEDFKHLIKYAYNNGAQKCDDFKLNELKDWLVKNDPKTNEIVKKTDYYYYFIIAIIVIVIAVFILIMIYSPKTDPDVIEDIIKEENKSNKIEVQVEDMEELYE